MTHVDVRSIRPGQQGVSRLDHLLPQSIMARPEKETTLWRILLVSSVMVALAVALPACLSLQLGSNAAPGTPAGPAGAYLYRVTVGDQLAIGKVVVLD